MRYEIRTRRHLRSDGHAAHRVYPPGRQAGAVLVMGLIILLILMLIGVQAAKTNVAQQRMAANWHDRHTAFEAAEAALLLGERLGPFDAAAAPAALADPASWDGITDRAGSIPDFAPALAREPSFHVGPAQMVRVGIELPARWRRFHTVTGHGAGTQSSSVVILQSVYEPPD